MTMKVAQAGGCMVVTDRPGLHWLFYACFVAGGFVALWLSASDTSNTWASAIGVVVGLGNIAAGLFMIAREPASRVEVDRAAASIRITRWGIAGKCSTSFAMSELEGVEQESTEHSDGGKVFRPRMRFTSSRDVPVTLAWRQKSADVMAIVRALGAHMKS